jgi:hypothetical protein
VANSGFKIQNFIGAGPNCIAEFCKQYKKFVKKLGSSEVSMGSILAEELPRQN